MLGVYVKVGPQDAPVTSQPFAGDPSQSSVPAEHATQAAPVQVWVSGVHAAAVPHCPLELHVWTASPEHCVAPGAQIPVHAPETHADAVQVTGAPYCPLALHVSTPLPEHVVPPGAHTPVQAPETQVWFEQG